LAGDDGFGQSPGNGRVWFVSVFDHEPLEGDRLAARVQALIARIAGTVSRSETAGPMLRIALPVLGIGKGGMGSQRGAVLDTLLRALWDSVQANAVDVVLVASNASVFSAAQHRRRALAASGGAPNHWGLTEADLHEAQRLGRLASDGHLALFIGAGVNKGVGLPGWNELLERIAKRVGVDPAHVKELGALDAAQLLQDKADPKDLGALVRQILVADKPRIALAHALLAGLGAREAITTNYDALYERAVEETGGERPSVLPWDAAQPGRPWLLKLHGDLEKPESIVLTRRDFVLFDARSRPAGSLLQATLMTKHLLIVGASLEDDNVIRLAMEVDDYLTRNPPTPGVQGTFIPGAQGTFIDVTGKFARKELWNKQFHWFVCGGDDTPQRVRQMEIFLDVVAAYAARNAPWLLDERFSGLLDPDERRVVDAVRAALAQVPDATGGLLAPLRQVREQLGGAAGK